MCRDPVRGLLSIGFADDLNILVYKLSTESNYRTLERTYIKCLKWASKFNIKFTPKKYKLIHFTTVIKRFNLSATNRIREVVKSPTKEVKVLRVWFDPKLKWTIYIKQIKTKMAT